MKAFVDKQLLKSSEILKDDDEFYIERKQLNSLHNYFSNSLLYLERLDSTSKNINIMISDLNSCLKSFFKNDVKIEIINHITNVLKSFKNAREQITEEITKSKSMVNNYIEKIKNLDSLCIKKKNFKSAIEHYEKKIKKLQSLISNQKHIDKVIRNEHKLNKVKTDYLECHENIKKGFDSILENKTNKVLFDSKKNLEILLSYFSRMNSICFKLKDPLNELNSKYIKRKNKSLPIQDNFFFNEEDKMNYFSEKKKNNNTNPFSNDIENFENNQYKSLTNNNSENEYKYKKNNSLFKIKSFLRGNNKNSKIKDSPANFTPVFPK